MGGDCLLVSKSPDFRSAAQRPATQQVAHQGWHKLPTDWSNKEYWVLNFQPLLHPPPPSKLERYSVPELVPRLLLHASSIDCFITVPNWKLANQKLCLLSWFTRNHVTDLISCLFSPRLTMVRPNLPDTQRKCTKMVQLSANTVQPYCLDNHLKEEGGDQIIGLIPLIWA